MAEVRGSSPLPPTIPSPTPPKIPPPAPSCAPVRLALRGAPDRAIFIAQCYARTEVAPMAGYRIMVVDDDPDVRFVVSSLLSLEFETTQALNGLDALEKIERHDPDLLLLDVNMPVMNGLSCCSAIQRNPQFENLPVIFLTANSGEAFRSAAMKAGAFDYILKPFDTAELIATIHRCFAEKGLQPRPKAFALEELREIDATPLMATEPAAPPPPPPPPTDGKRRRVFGRQPSATETVRTLPPEVIEAAAAETKPPEAPAVDYERVSKELARAAEFRRSQEEQRRAEREAREAAERQRREQEARAAREREDREAELRRREEELRRREEEARAAREREDREAELRRREEELRRREEELRRAAEQLRQAPPPAPMRPVAPPPTAQRPAPPPATPPPTAPAQPSAAEILAQRRLRALGQSRPAEANARPRILVLIDGPRQLETCHNAFKGLAEFLPLEDAVEAVELIARFQPDIVMFGIAGPDYSGLQLAQLIQSNPRLAHIEILFIHNRDVDERTLSAIRRHTRNALLRPPLTEESLRRALQEITSRAGFAVRAKNLSYGVYVKEVIRAADQERAKENKYREKEALADKMSSLKGFMARELRDYKDLKLPDDPNLPGNRVYEVQN